jgi:glycosyltransferase involved in cell wall biosynthesis
VHAHSSKAGILGRVAAAWARVPAVVYSPHAFAFQIRTHPARRALYLSLERWAGRRTHCLVAVSQAEAALAVAARVVPSERVVVIPNGIDPAEAAPPEAGEAVRKELGIAPGVPVVLFAGRLAEQKAPEVMVAAALRVLPQHPQTRFLLAGEGPLRPRLAAMIGSAADRVRLLGHRADMPALYAAAQVFVLPSRWEGLPYAPLEAMNAGLPVVATDLPALREIVIAGQTGTLVPVDDPDALAAAMAALLSDARRAQQMGQAGRERVRQHFCVARQIDELAHLYRRLAPHASS